MNKQAITFLSLFSIILVLSIYYILLPPVDNTSVESTYDTIEQLQNELDQKRESIISENNSIISKETSTTESISKALETITEAKNLTEKEKSIIEKLKEKGYDKSFVEIDKQTIKVTVVKKDASSKEASSIMKIVLDCTNEQYSVEVKFVDE